MQLPERLFPARLDRIEHVTRTVMAICLTAAAFSGAYSVDQLAEGYAADQRTEQLEDNYLEKISEPSDPGDDIFIDPLQEAEEELEHDKHVEAGRVEALGHYGNSLLGLLGTSAGMGLAEVGRRRRIKQIERRVYRNYPHLIR